MANVFINLPSPTGNGVGTPVDVSGTGAVKTFVVGGGANATINVELNNDIGQGGSWQSVATFHGSGSITVAVAAKWLRVRISAYVSGTVEVDFGAVVDTVHVAALPVPAGTGVGAAVDVSALPGLFKTCQVGGAYRGTIIVEISEDGTDWAQPWSFQTPGASSLVLAAAWMRVRRLAVPTVDPGAPLVNVAFATEGDVPVTSDFAVGAGTQTASTGTVIFANSNGVSFGMSGLSQITASISGGAPETPFGIAAGSQSVSTGTITLGNANGLTFGMGGSNLITGAYSQSTNLAAAAAGTQTATSGTLVFANGNGVTFGMAGSSQITASISQSTSPAAIAAGTQTATSGTVMFSNSNGITFGMVGSTQITASYSQSMNLGAAAAGTQTQTSGTLVFANSNGVTFGMSGSSQVTASVAAGGMTVSFFQVGQNVLVATTAIGNGTVMVQPVTLPNVAFSQINIPINLANDAASTGTATGSFFFGIYTRNASTLSLLASTSLSVTLAYSGTVNNSLLAGNRLVTAPWTSSISAGLYWAALGSSTTFSSQNCSFSNMFISQDGNVSFSGLANQASAASAQMQLGLGSYSVQTAAIPASLAFSDIQGTAPLARRAPVFQLMNLSA